MKVLLDTHIWLWWLTGHGGLSGSERSALDRAAELGDLCIAAISLWEAQMLYSKRRLELPLPFADWLRRATAHDAARILPLDAEVVISLDALPRSFHGDPADRLIVATARAHALPLATRDELIRKSRLAAQWNAGGRRTRRKPAET